MTHRNNKRAEELLGRFLNGECSAEEQTLVESWYDNLQLDTQDTTVWAEASKRRFLQDRAAGSRKRSMLFSIKWAAAAALMLLLTGTAFFLFRNDLPDDKAAPLAHTATTGAAALKQIILPDSTVVWLNANSTLHWTEDYKSGRRYVSLNGEASFDVHHDTAHPFVVHTADADIKVLGTCFNVATDNRDVGTQVALLRGKVAISLNTAKKQDLVLMPGEVASCAAGAEILRKENDDVSSYFSWMNGGFAVHDMPLEYALQKLCARYGYTLQWKEQRGGNKHISVAFAPQGFRSMLESLCFVNHLHYTIHDHNIVIQ